MATIFHKAYYTPPGGTEVEITDLLDTKQQRGLEIKSSKTDLLLSTSQNKYKTGGVSDFVEDGTIEVYVDNSAITRTSSQLLLTGQITQISNVFSEAGAQQKITAADRTVLLLGGLWSFTYENQNPSEIIISVVEQVSGGEVTTSNVATSTVGGPAFADITQFSFVFKPVYDWVKELSQPEYTGEDRGYMFYVDKDNDLHWFYPSQTSDGTLIEGTDNIYDIKLKRNNNKIVNMVVFNAGQDLNGNGVLWYYQDTTSRSNVLHAKFQPMTDLGRDLIKAEITSGNLVESTSGTVPFQGKLYAVANSYPFTTSWGVSASSFDDYNSDFRDELKSVRGKNRAQKITQRFGKLVWEGSIVLKGTNSYVAGNLITLTSKTLGLSSQLLRVIDVTHSIGLNGWKTSLQLMEDEDALTS